MNLRCTSILKQGKEMCKMRVLYLKCYDIFHICYKHSINDPMKIKTFICLNAPSHFTDTVEHWEIQLTPHIPYSFAFPSQEVWSTISPTTAMASISIFASWKQINRYNTILSQINSVHILFHKDSFQYYPLIYAEVSQVISLFNMAQYNLFQDDLFQNVDRSDLYLSIYIVIFTYYMEYFTNKRSLQSKNLTHEAKYFLPMEALLLGMLSSRDMVPWNLKYKFKKCKLTP